ncbi:hypothetical protein [Mesorhizobium amorphae]|uniref:hypothetical protein n=1 Tax=Mesorhizobium amorphae TaxID=71433 RepID=UPI001786EB7A|nr:hypothetical protein [Mesorhizobium amorphae]
MLLSAIVRLAAAILLKQNGECPIRGMATNSPSSVRWRATENLQSHRIHNSQFHTPFS